MGANPLPNRLLEVCTRLQFVDLPTYNTHIHSASSYFTSTLLNTENWYMKTIFSKTSEVKKYATNNHWSQQEMVF